MHVLITFSLVPIIVMTAPRYETKYVSKPLDLLQYSGGAKVNILPEEDKIPDWQNPWINTSGRMSSIPLPFPLPPPLNVGSSMSNNPGLIEMKWKKGDPEVIYDDSDDAENMMKRSYYRSMFRLFKKSLENKNSVEEKRNSVPMMG